MNMMTKDNGSEIGKKGDNERRGQDGSMDLVKLTNLVSGGEKWGRRAIAPSVYYKGFHIYQSLPRLEEMEWLNMETIAKYMHSENKKKRRTKK
jgi:hypothetical protein